MGKADVAEGVGVIRTIFFGSGTGFAFLITLQEEAPQTCLLEQSLEEYTVTGLWRMNQGMFFQFSGNRRRRFINPVCDITDKEIFPEKQSQ